MLKKFLTISTISSSFLFAQPSYAMDWCCADDDDQPSSASSYYVVGQSNIQEQDGEETKLNQKPTDYSATLQKSIQEQKKGIENSVPQIQTERDANHPNPQNSTHQQKRSLTVDREHTETTSERQVVCHGNISIECPKDLTLVINNDGSKSLILKDIFKIQLFPSYDSALETNTEVLALHQIELILKSKHSLTGRMERFYNDVRSKTDQDDKQAAENVISCIKIVVDKIPDQGPYPVKLAVDQKTTRCSVLFKIEDSALLVKGPGNPEKKELK